MTPPKPKGRVLLRLPSTIRVGPFDYDVVSMSPEEKRQFESAGVWDHDVLSIRLDMTLAWQLRFETLLHEIGHAINWLSGIDDETSEEDTVDWSTPVWMQVWRDNPGLFDCLEFYVKAGS